MMQTTQAAFLLSATVAACGIASAVAPVSAPPGWTAFAATGPGTVASFRFPEPDGTFHQTLSATVVTNYASLDDFVTRNTQLLKNAAGYRVDSAAMIEACGQPAWRVAYTHPGTVAATRDLTIVTEQVVSVRDGRAVIATYVRTDHDEARADAETWLRGLCGLN